MPTTHITIDDLLVYGPKATQTILADLVGLDTHWDVMLKFLCGELDHATASVADLVETTRELDADRHVHVEEKAPALTAARALLGRFSAHLDAQPTHVNRKVFFTHDGTAHGVGRSASRVLFALTHLEQLLGKSDVGITEAAAWKKQVHASIHALAPAIEQADAARLARAHGTPQLQAARQAWLNIYLATKAGAESLLRYVGSLDLMPRFFGDLAVVHGHAAEKDAAPPAAPTAPAAPSGTAT
jgi:hypothetical protein